MDIDPAGITFEEVNWVALWRVDVAGVPVLVRGLHSYDHLRAVNSEMARMKMALHRILHINPDDEHAIHHAQNAAQDGLEKSP